MSLFLVIGLELDLDGLHFDFRTRYRLVALTHGVDLGLLALVASVRDFLQLFRLPEHLALDKLGVVPGEELHLQLLVVIGLAFSQLGLLVLDLELCVLQG